MSVHSGDLDAHMNKVLFQGSRSPARPSEQESALEEASGDDNAVVVIEESAAS